MVAVPRNAPFVVLTVEREELFRADCAGRPLPRSLVPPKVFACGLAHADGPERRATHQTFSETVRQGRAWRALRLPIAPDGG